MEFGLTKIKYSIDKIQLMEYQRIRQMHYKRLGYKKATQEAQNLGTRNIYQTGETIMKYHKIEWNESSITLLDKKNERIYRRKKNFK